MFHNLPRPIRERMAYLEARDARDRQDGTPHLQRMRQIPPETGRFLALIAASAPEGRYIELGTSAGYSALWISLACSATGRTLTTFEVLDEKVALATETFSITGITDKVNLVAGDARQFLPDMENIAFCFIDSEKNIYDELYDLVVPRMVSGGKLVIDNVVSHQEFLQPFIDRVLADSRLDSVIVPIGRGELLCRKP